MTFGEKLRELREAKGWTQYELADLAEVKQPTVARWETGAVTPAYDVVLKLCALLGVRLRVFEDCEIGPAEEKRGRGRPPKES